MTNTRSPRRLGVPRPVEVRADECGVPERVGGREVLHVRDEWRVDEGWWTRRPVSRRYFELVLEDGRNSVVFLDRRGKRWYGQRV